MRVCCWDDKWGVAQTATPPCDYCKMRCDGCRPVHASGLQPGHLRVAASGQAHLLGLACSPSCVHSRLMLGLAKPKSSVPDHPNCLRSAPLPPLVQLAAAGPALDRQAAPRPASPVPHVAGPQHRAQLL